MKCPSVTFHASSCLRQKECYFGVVAKAASQNDIDISLTPKLPELGEKSGCHLLTLKLSSNLSHYVRCFRARDNGCL